MPKLNCFLLIILLIIAFIPGQGLANKSIRTNQFLIVIDPGHGGSQTGIIAPSNLIEKNITLKLAKKTAEKLDTHYNVLLTRSKDTPLLAKQRVSMANTNNADLFISIHLSQPGRRTGFFHYFSSPITLVSPSTIQKGIWKTTALKHTLASKLLAETFLNIFSKHNKTLLFSTKASPTILLEGTSMPAILIEPFPISILPANNTERDAILDEYAILISKSIDSFLKKTFHNQ